jgi:hypothetical protein
MKTRLMHDPPDNHNQLFHVHLTAARDISSIADVTPVRTEC